VFYVDSKVMTTESESVFLRSASILILNIESLKQFSTYILRTGFYFRFPISQTLALIAKVS